jgi:hypothetical protein
MPSICIFTFFTYIYTDRPELQMFFSGRLLHESPSIDWSPDDPEDLPEHVESASEHICIGNGSGGSRLHTSEKYAEEEEDMVFCMADCMAGEGTAVVLDRVDPGVVVSRASSSAASSTSSPPSSSLSAIRSKKLAWISSSPSLRQQHLLNHVSRF